MWAYMVWSIQSEVYSGKIIQKQNIYRFTTCTQVLETCMSSTPLWSVPVPNRASWSWLCAWRRGSSCRKRPSAGTADGPPPQPGNVACSPCAWTDAPVSPSWVCCGPRSSPDERWKFQVEGGMEKEDCVNIHKTEDRSITSKAFIVSSQWWTV